MLILLDSAAVQRRRARAAKRHWPQGTIYLDSFWPHASSTSWQGRYVSSDQVYRFVEVITKARSTVFSSSRTWVWKDSTELPPGPDTFRVHGNTW